MDFMYSSRTINFNLRMVSLSHIWFRRLSIVPFKFCCCCCYCCCGSVELQLHTFIRRIKMRTEKRKRQTCIVYTLHTVRSQLESEALDHCADVYTLMFVVSSSSSQSHAPFHVVQPLHQVHTYSVFQSLFFIMISFLCLCVFSRAVECVYLFCEHRTAL